MSWPQSIFVALLTGVLALVVGGLVMIGCAKWHNISDFEGKSGFAIVGVALLSGVAGTLLGIGVSRAVAAGTDPSFLRGLGYSWGTVLVIALVAAGLGRLTGAAEVAPDVPSSPTFEALAAQEAAVDQATFDAMPADAAIATWFPYTRYGAADDRRSTAIRNITARADWVAELGALMVAEEREVATEAMYLVQHLPEPPTALNTAVSAAGRDLVARIERVNATPVEVDPGYHGVAEVSLRFSAWIRAARTLHEASGGDFVPELRQILELSRIRTDSEVMRSDVRRVSSYYANAWAGIAPLPDDPPPK